MFRRFLSALATITVLAVGIPATAAAAPVSEVPPYDPPKTPGKMKYYEGDMNPESFTQPKIRWTVFARPYGRVPAGRSIANKILFNDWMDYRGTYGQPPRYSLFYETKAECDAVIVPEGYIMGPLIIPSHFIWMAQNDWTEQLVHTCYQIFNGMWVYEYINFFEIPLIKNIDGLPGRYPKDVPPEQRQYQKPY